MEKETVVKCKQENCDKVKHGYRNNSVFFCLSNLLRLPGIFLRGTTALNSWVIDYVIPGSECKFNFIKKLYLLARLAVFDPPAIYTDTKSLLCT